MGRAKLPRGNCLNCGAQLDRREKRYCNLFCQQSRARRLYVAAWLDGNASGVDSWGNVSGHVRRYLFDTSGVCVMCGWAERHPVTGRIPLHIDHIDGDWRNNRPENLRLLCPNHHALTPSYGALNRGNGRPYHMIKTGRQM
ncbi:MAG: HNH endonuclease [Chloroflexi bacterium]|nr:MAG: HNH endonuclease [Chloroflexota bacterium]